MADLTDAELVALVRAGKLPHYSQLVKRYEQAILRYVHSILRDGDDADDAAQETFLKAYRNLWAFDVSRSFSSWLYRIAHNEAITLIRKRGRYVTGEPADVILEQQPSANRPDHEYAETELKELVQSSLDQIPFIYREPLVLHFLEGLSYQEISDILRIPTNTVGSRISRAKGLMKQSHPGGSHGR